MPKKRKECRKSLGLKRDRSLVVVRCNRRRLCFPNDSMANSAGMGMPVATMESEDDLIDLDGVNGW